MKQSLFVVIPNGSNVRNADAAGFDERRHRLEPYLMCSSMRSYFMCQVNERCQCAQILQGGGFLSHFYKVIPALLLKELARLQCGACVLQNKRPSERRRRLGTVPCVQCAHGIDPLA